MKKYFPLAIAAATLLLAAPFADAQSDRGLTPVVVTPAQTLPSPSASGSSGGGGFDFAGLTELAYSAIGFINGVLVPLLIAIAFLVFLYGVANAYILNGANEEKRKEGHQFILWSIIGFVVIFSLWGLVNLVMGTFNLSGNGSPPPYPTL